MAAKKKSVKLSKMPDGRMVKNITEEEWELIAEFYAQHGEQHIQAAKRFGYVRRTMVRLYYEGSKSLNKPPIKGLMQDVQLRARAIRNQMADDEVRAAEKEMQGLLATVDKPEVANSLVDAAEARAHEGMLVSVGRRNITAYSLILGKIMQKIQTKMPEIEASLDDMTGRQLIALFKDLSKPVVDIQGAVSQVLEAERLLMGQPTALIGVSAGGMDKDKAMQVLALTNKTYLRLQRDAPDAIAAKVKIEPELPIPSADDVYEAHDGASQEDASSENGAEEACDEDDSDAEAP